MLSSAILLLLWQTKVSKLLDLLPLPSFRSVQSVPFQFAVCSMACLCECMELASAHKFPLSRQWLNDRQPYTLLGFLLCEA